MRDCVHNLPQVFKADERPWIVVDGAAADAIAATIERCPTGALDDVRSRGLRVVPICPFVRTYLQHHPEYEDLVVPDRRVPR